MSDNYPSSPRKRGPRSTLKGALDSRLRGNDGATSEAVSYFYEDQ